MRGIPVRITDLETELPDMPPEVRVFLKECMLSGLRVRIWPSELSHHFLAYVIDPEDCNNLRWMGLQGEANASKEMRFRLWGAAKGPYYYMSVDKLLDESYEMVRQWMNRR